MNHNTDLKNLREFSLINRDYLTFYHELRVPEHQFFKGKENDDKKNKIIIISSPSRMGNHLILSMLDNHSEIPKIPGEDGFLFFSFWQANYDIHDFLINIRKKRNLDYIQQLSTNLRINKWYEFKKNFEKGNIPKKYSGIHVDESPAILDFQDTIFDINYNGYKNYLKNNLKDLPESTFFKNFLNIYLKSLLHLDFEFPQNQYSFDGYLVFSGMRTQLLWILTHYKRVKILISLRPFETYALSHVRARYKNKKINAELAQEAWEHWYHKVIDCFYLKLKYPDNVCLVSFEDILNNTKKIANSIADFLEVKFEDSMLTPTIFGNPVKGNAALGQDESKRGEFYKPKDSISKHYIPADYYHLWKSFDLIKTF